MAMYKYEVTMSRQPAQETATFVIEFEHNSDDEISLEDEIERIALEHVDFNLVKWESTDEPCDLAIEKMAELKTSEA